MVLRRPYAFFIKHFRLIHLIIAAIFLYLAKENRDIYKYIISVTQDVVNKYNANLYIHGYLFILILVALLLCLAVYFLMRYKDKPRKIYLVTIIGYIIISIYLFLLFGYMKGFNNNVIDAKTIRFYRDIHLITLLFQYLITIIMLIRGLGFNIKKFNFEADVNELGLSEEDSEEIEINTEINTNNAKRLIHRSKRELGYFYQEYKVIINLILIIVILIVGYSGYRYLGNKLKVYHQDELFGVINKITVKNSYYQDGYIIVNIDIYKNGGKEQLNTGNMVLSIGNKTFIPDKNICNRFNNLGTCYKKQYITNEVNNYILVYDIGDIKLKNTYLKYVESYNKTYKVKLEINQS